MSDEVDKALSDLEHKIDRLKVLYEQYFIGIERAEPLVPRKEVVRVIAALQHAQIRNTALRFRYQTLNQRWNLLTARWGKTLREIETGTYVRHLARAQRRGIELPQEMARAAARLAGRSVVGASDDDDAPTAPIPYAETDASGGEWRRDATMRGLGSGALTHLATEGPAGLLVRSATRSPGVPPPLPPGVGRPPPPTPTPSPIPGMSDSELRALHQRYVKERGSEMKFEAMVAALQQQVPRILERHRCEGVSFELHSQNGKVVLKGTPKRG